MTHKFPIKLTSKDKQGLGERDRIIPHSTQYLTSLSLSFLIYKWGLRIKRYTYMSND